MAAVNARPVATTYEYGGAPQGHFPYGAYSQGGGGAYQWPHAQHPAPHQVFVPGLASRNACAECVRARARVGPCAQHPAPHQVLVSGRTSRNACAECPRARARSRVRGLQRG